MKKTIIAASLVAIGFAITAFVSPHASDNNSFEGVVTYSVAIKTDNPQLAAMMQGTTEKAYVKGDKMRIALDMNAQKITIFKDKKTPDSPVMLMEVMDKKYQVKQDSASNVEPVIKYSDETKIIAGYTCHKADISITDKDGQKYTSPVYYTQEIPYFTGLKDPLRGLKGFPLEFSLKQPGVTLSFSATGVVKQSLTDDTFTVPTGYKLKTMNEIYQELSQMGGGN